MNRVTTACLIASMFLSAVRAQDVPPPPKPPDAGPSLEDTMKFLEEKLGSIGHVNYMVYLHDNVTGNDWTNRFFAESTKVRTSAQTCTLFFHNAKGREGVTDNLDADITFPLKIVSEVLVMTEDQRLKEATAKSGHPEWTTRSDPPVFVISPRAKGLQTPYWTEFVLYDESLANRIAKALTHAVELCGGGNKEPF